MPEQIPTSLPEPQIHDLEAQPFTSPALDPVAQTTVNEHFAHYSAYRQMNHDPRWQRAESLYAGEVAARRWEGTNVPRANLSIQLVFDQVQTALPLIEAALFGSPDWFAVEPEAGTDPREAIARKAVMDYIFEHPTKNYGSNAIAEMCLAIEDTLKFGNGFICEKYDPETGLPVVEWVDLRDVYTDPACKTPWTNDGRSLIYRDLMTVDDLYALKGVPGMRIPSRGMLVLMANNRSITPGDQAVQNQEAASRTSYAPGIDDFLPTPTDRYVEVLIYTSKRRIIWLLNRVWVAYNEENPYGFINYDAAVCYRQTKRFYGTGFADRQRDNQVGMEALWNGHLDELSLALNPPRARKRGGPNLPSSFRLRPGADYQVDDPQKDMVVMNPMGITTNVAGELQFFKGLAQERTGMNSLMTQGVPLQSNASRTGAGIQAQSQGPLSRLQKIVKNIEDFMLVPMLYKVSRMLEIIAEREPNKMFPGVLEGKPVQVPASVFSRPVKFRMLAASKMLTREKLQGLVPVVGQTFMNPSLMAEATKTGKTLDFDTVARFLQDATGTGRSYSFFRQMTPQEQQMAMQPPPEAQMRMQEKQLDQQTRLTLSKDKKETALTTAALTHESTANKTDQEMAMRILELLANSRKEAAIDKGSTGEQGGAGPNGAAGGSGPESRLG